MEKCDENNEFVENLEKEKNARRAKPTQEGAHRSKYLYGSLEMKYLCLKSCICTVSCLMLMRRFLQSSVNDTKMGKAMNP